MNLRHHCVPAGWRIQIAAHHLGPWQCQRDAWCEPQAPLVSWQHQPGPLSTGSARPSHQGDGGRGRGYSVVETILNSCSGSLSGGGCQANMSTWNPLGQQPTQRKAHLRGLHCRLPAGQPCHWHSSAVQDMRPHFLTPLFVPSSPHRRAHFLHGPYPATHFGPKACILPNPTSVM